MGRGHASECKGKPQKGGAGGSNKEPRRRTPRAGNHRQPATARDKARGRKGGKWEATEITNRAGSPRGGRANRETNENGHRKGEAHQNAPKRPARPSGPRKAQSRTRVRDRGVVSSSQKGEVLAFTRKSPGALAEYAVESLTARANGRQNERVHTRQTTAAHAARDQRRRELPQTTPQRSPERVPRRASQVPPLRGWAAAGTMSLVVCRPPRAPRSRRVNPVAKAPGRGRHHGNGEADRSTDSDQTGGGPAHQC